MRKCLYFLQLYLTGIFTSADELQNKPHNACRIRNNPVGFDTRIIIAEFFINSKIILHFTFSLQFKKILKYGKMKVCINFGKKPFKY